MADPSDAMRASRALAPQDARLNDLRWLTGVTLQRVRDRAALDGPQAEIALRARETLQRCEAKAGPAAWPIVKRIVLEGGDVRAFRELTPEIVTAWRADAVCADHLRTALDRLGALLGVTGR